MNPFGRREKGQTIVIVALMLVALLIFVALAIDIGLLHLERRHMQNAADAGALAGARELCLGRSASEAIAKAREYAIVQNRAQEADVTVEGNIVTVVAKKQADLFFGGVTGVGSRLVTAEAKAACGKVTEACGLWPVAFFRGAWNKVLKEEGCDREFYVWTDDKVFACSMDECPPSDPNCAVYDCDINDDTIDDVIHGGDRGWLDLSGVAGPYGGACVQPGCGEKEIRCLLENNSGLMFSLPACISGASGVKEGAVIQGVPPRVGQVVAIPLYDRLGCADPSGNCPGGERYWVTTIGCVTVLGWERLSLRIKEPPTPTPTPTVGPGTPTPQPQPTPTPTKPGGGGGGAQVINSVVIKVRLNCNQSCISYCGSTDGSLPNPWDMKAVSLIK